jgi:hypothetical protein
LQEAASTPSTAVSSEFRSRRRRSDPSLDGSDDTRLPGDTHAEFSEFLIEPPRSRAVPLPSGTFTAIPPPPPHSASEAMLGVPNVETLLPARLVEDGDA